MTTTETIDYRSLSDTDWRKRLTANQYTVLRQHGTERPGTSPLNKEKRKATRFAMEQQHLQMGPRGRLAIEQGPRDQREVQMLEDVAEDNMPVQLQRLDLDEYIHYE